MVRSASLLKKFAVLSAVTITLLGVGVGWLISSQIEGRALAEASSSAELFANSVVRPLFTHAHIEEGLTPDQIDRLDSALAPALEGGTVQRIKVWDPEGRVVYSDDRDLIDQVFPRNHHLAEALEGAVEAEVEERDDAEHEGETIEGASLEVYVPLQFEGEDEPSGAFEMYFAYEPTALAISKDTRELSFALAAALLVLYGLLFRIVAGASSKLRRQAEENERLALYDPLTNLPNRVLFRDRVEQAVRLAKREVGGLAVMILDLDRFKEINDTLGHHTGDMLLMEIGPRLRTTLRDVDTVARMGGDEIGILLPGVNNEDAVQAVARKIERALAQPFSVNGLTLEVEASMGSAMFPEQAADADELLQRADVAMYAAKENRTGHEIYSVERDKYSPDRLILLGELRQAIDDGDIVLHYQPKLDLKNGHVVGVEALARWQHPTRGLLPPIEFIPLAEPTGLMRALTAHVLDRALAQCHVWHARGMDLSVAINLSVRNLHDATLPNQVARALSRWSIEPTKLELEITESAIMQEPARVLEVVERLHALGVKLSIDDFGVGQSSLTYLKRLPVDQLKIDRSFVMNLAEDQNDEAIVHSTVQLGVSLGLQVVAEGVETAAAWDRLAEMGCHLAQGFYMSKPLPPEALIDWLSAHSGTAIVPRPMSASTATAD